MQRTESVVPPTPAAVLTSPPHSELSELLRVLQAVRDGDFSVRLPGDWTGLEGKIADTVNEIVKSNARMASEDRKSTRLNSSHSQISYAVFCLKKKKKK